MQQLLIDDDQDCLWLRVEVAGSGASCHVGYRSCFYRQIAVGSGIQDSVVIHGLEQGRVGGDDGQAYSVWVGDNTCITHLALIHGPAYVGNNCFIGFRSTVFNAKVGHGCIVMMHVLIQDVEIPAGRYVPSGVVITTQQAADRLPEAKDSVAEGRSLTIAFSLTM